MASDGFLPIHASTSNTGLAGYFICRLCDFRAVSGDALAVHNGTKHAQFLDLMPDDVANAYRDFANRKSAGKKRPFEEIPNGVARQPSIEDEKFSCPSCSAEFDQRHKLAHHMTNINCRPTPTRKSTRPATSGGPVRCKVCDEEVGSFLQYKCHLFGHFERQLAEDWSEKFKASGGKCVECGSSDIAVAADEDGRSMFVRHLAIDHDKIFDMLSVEIRQHMRIAFDDGSVALPPTPPPPESLDGDDQNK